MIEGDAMRKWAPKLRKLFEYVSLSVAASTALFLYHQITKPYQVRYFVAPDASDLAKIRRRCGRAFCAGAPESRKSKAALAINEPAQFQLSDPDI